MKNAMALASGPIFRPAHSGLWHPAARTAGLALLATSVAIMTAGGAVIIDISPGTNAPPATLGFWALGAGFPTETRPEFSLVADVEVPLLPGAWPPDGRLGVFSFSSPMELNYVGSGWGSWSHGYSGPVYVTYGGAIELLFPDARLVAFYLYIQPSLVGVSEFTVFAQGNYTSVTETVRIDGDGGASFVGIYAGHPLEYLHSMTIMQTGGLAGGFAIGEFAARGIPEPAQVAGLGFLLASGLALRSRRNGR